MSFSYCNLCYIRIWCKTAECYLCRNDISIRSTSALSKLTFCILTPCPYCTVSFQCNCEFIAATHMRCSSVVISVTKHSNISYCRLIIFRIIFVNVSNYNLCFTVMSRCNLCIADVIIRKISVNLLSRCYIIIEWLEYKFLCLFKVNLSAQTEWTHICRRNCNCIYKVAVCILFIIKNYIVISKSDVFFINNARVFTCISCEITKLTAVVLTPCINQSVIKECGWVHTARTDTDYCSVCRSCSVFFIIQVWNKICCI